MGQLSLVNVKSALYGILYRLLPALPVAVLLLAVSCVDNPWSTPTPTPAPLPLPRGEAFIAPPSLGPNAGGRDAMGNSVPAAAGGKIGITSNPDGSLNVSLPVALAKGARLSSFSDSVSGAVLTDNGLVIPVRDFAGKLAMNLLATVRPLLGTGTTAVGLIEKLELDTLPLVGDLDAKVGTVSFQVRAELKTLPDGAGISMVLSRTANLAVYNAFDQSVRKIQNSIREIAFVAEVNKTRMVDGRDIGPATVTLSVGRNWADSMGLQNIVVTVLRDDGSVELLTTKFVNYNADGQAVFAAASQKGVSTFGLVGLNSAAPTPTPAPRFFTLTVQNDSPGYGAVRVEPASGNATYLQGTPLVLRALASPGHKFERWEGDAFGNQSRLDIVMDSDKHVRAIFSLLSYAINTDSLPRNGGTVDISPYITEYDYGTRVTLAARPSAGFTFKSWSGDVTGTDATITFVVDGPKNITANFSTVRYTFTSSVNPPGSGTVSPPNATLDKGSNLTVAAALSQGWTFSYWSGDASGTTNPVTVVMDRDKRLVANFTRASYSLSSSAIPATGGSVSPSGGRFSYGETVTLTATSVQDYFFNGWGGDVSGSENPKTITILKDTNVSATFVQRHFSLAVSINPSGAGFVSPTSYGLYAMGSIVILSASPAANYRFVSWTGDVNSQSPLIDVQINRNIAVTANFVLVPPQAQFR